MERVEVAGFYCSFSAERSLARDEGPGCVSGTVVGQLRARAATVGCEFECVSVRVEEKWWKWVEVGTVRPLHVEAVCWGLRGVACSGGGRVTCGGVGIARVARLGGHWSR